MDRISIVVPCFNEEEALPVYYREMKRVMGELSEVSFEILFVDDGSSDKTLEILKQLNAKDGRCEYLSFSRNFGKEAAIYAGKEIHSHLCCKTTTVCLVQLMFLPIAC